MARLTFPDQQQDLQNAAGFTVATECDGSVKFARLVVPNVGMSTARRPAPKRAILFDSFYRKHILLELPISLKCQRGDLIA